MSAQAQDLIGRVSDISTEITRVKPAKPDPAITPMQMLQIAVEKGASLEQLSKLMDLQERWEANEARKAFVVAKAAFKADAPKLGKNKTVSYGEGNRKTTYDHATLDHVAETLSPVLSKHGLAYSWQTEQADAGLITVTCVLTHVLGHSERVSLRASPDTSGSKNGIQAVGSTVTYLQRYTLLAITGMATTDQDNDGAGGPVEYISADQKQELIALMKETKADTVAFLKYFGVESLDVLPVTEFDRAVAALNKKKQGA